MTRKVVVPDIHIILVNFVLHAKQKGFVEQAVRTNPLTNAACALNVPYIVLILWKMSVLSKISRLMFVMAAVSCRNVRC